MMEAILKRGTLLTVVTAMILLLGITAALRVPVQMIPDLDTRLITVETRWPGATPQDVEKEILIEQEKYLRGLPDLTRMTSEAATGRATIELEFPFGIQLNEALLRVNNALSQVPSYPENVDQPALRSDSFSYNPFMSYRVVPLDGNPKRLDMNMMLDFIDDNARAPLERVPGVSQVELRGGAERQIQILVDPAKLAERGISLSGLREAVRQRNTDVSAGDIDSGKRRYLMRTTGRFKSLDDMRDLILSRRGDSITRLGDVAEVRLSHFELRNLAYTDGEPNIRLSLIRETGSNVIAIKEAAEPVVEQVNRDILRPAGLQMLLSNDDVRYVEASVRNVRNNILIGAILAAAVLYAFLRCASSTLIGMCGMPVCAVASFIGLLLLDRTVNVISLAGVAFAIGMTIDNTIVVLESIHQERVKGKTRFQSALDGTRNVASAVLSGTMTTVLVFLPVLFVKEEAGQLFSDIGIGADEFGFAVSALADRAFIDEFYLGDDKIDIFLYDKALYRHWGDPFLILATVPLGVSGGIAGLWLLNFIGAMLPALGLAAISQPFDMITMLGFLILLGISVNNPILIVDRAMHNFRIDGMPALEAVKDAVAARIRPVLMTTATTLIGLSPLVLLAGPGTELYRGLGAIVHFGLACSSLVTLTFLPALLVIVLQIISRFRADRIA